MLQRLLHGQLQLMGLRGKRRTTSTTHILACDASPNSSWRLQSALGLRQYSSRPGWPDKSLDP